MEISFVIVNYKSEAFLKKCLRSIRPCMEKVPCEIIIINNDRTPLEKDCINFPNTKIIDSPVNSGFAKACNLGADHAQGKYLFFLNPDTELKFSNIAELVSFSAEPGVGIVAPKLITASGEVQTWSAGYAINFWGIIENNLGCVRSSKIWQQDIISEVDWVSGAAFVISKELFESCSGFDEKFFMYFEDVDLCKKVQLRGQKILRVPSFTVLHLGGQSYRNEKKQKQQYYASQNYYFKKHYGSLSLFFLRLLRNFSVAFKLNR